MSEFAVCRNCGRAGDKSALVRLCSEDDCPLAEDDECRVKMFAIAPLAESTGECQV